MKWKWKLNETHFHKLESLLLHEEDAGNSDHSLSYNFEIPLISLGKSKLIQKNPVLCCYRPSIVSGALAELTPNLLNSLKRGVLLLPSLFYKWGKLGTEKLSYIPKLQSKYVTEAGFSPKPTHSGAIFNHFHLQGRLLDKS